MYIGDWQWIAWDNIPGGLDWVAFVLGGAGIGFTIVQLVRSKNALQAAKQALDDARLDLIGSRLAAVIPRLQEVISLLDTAVHENERVTTYVFLAEGSRRTAEVRALLEMHGYQDAELLGRMRRIEQDFPKVTGTLRKSDTATIQESIGYAMMPLRELSTDLERASTRSQNTISGSAQSVREVKRSK